MINKGHGIKRTTVSELIDDATTWKLIGTATGTTSITLPSSFKELHVKLDNPKQGTVVYTWNILREDLLSNGEHYFLGFTGSTANLDSTSGILNVSLTSINLISNSIYGTDYVNDSTITVYYR